MTETFQLDDDRVVPVLTRWVRHDYSAHVLRLDEGDERDALGETALTWSDGINVWYEEYEFPWLALARLAALVAAVEQDVFLVHDEVAHPGDERRFLDDANRFVCRTVHAFNCPTSCRGDSPNHDY